MIGQTLSHYRLVSLLGEGSYGAVYRAAHLHDAQLTVAVKVVHPALLREAGFVDALRRECRSLDRLDHPGIVRFRDLIVEGGQVAMVLELLEGEDLEAVLARGQQPVAWVLNLLERSLEALAYAHSRGVVHRDIKPANLYVCRDGRVKLMDFGLAYAADDGAGTRSGQLKGTPDYMAPERFRGERGPACDVYALGLVAWELLAGRRACAAGDMMAKVGWHLSVGAPEVRAARPDCPDWVAALLAAMTAREVTARPADAAAALAYFQQLRAAPGAQAPEPQPAPAPLPRGPPTVSLPPTGDPTAPPKRNLAGEGAPRGPSTVAVERPAPAPQAARAAAATPSGPPTGPRAPDAPKPAPAPAPSPAAKGPGGGRWVAAALGLLVAGGLAWRAASPAMLLAEAKRDFSTYALKPVPAGTYTIGCTPGQGGECASDETKREVTLTRGILVGTTEVTQGLYLAVMGDNPSHFDGCGLSCPLEDVSWLDAVAFANALSASEGLEPCYSISGETVSWPKGPACLGYRLPTDSEWEVAARGGRDDKYAGGGDLSSVGWTDENSGSKTHPVGQKTANGYGLYDMSGNVWEWTWDWYVASPEAGADPTGPASGSNRVYRGGSWGGDPQIARVARRDYYTPGIRNFLLGVRLLRTAP